MAQVERGLRSVLARASVYRLFQTLVGSVAVTTAAVQHLDIVPGQAILDIGCGTATVLERLPDVRYVGFDSSEDYVNAARERFGNRGRFFARRVDDAEVDGLLDGESFDRVLAKGVVHHLEDEEASKVFALAAEALRPGGKLVTVDPVLHDGQPRLARELVRRDRGRNVRTVEGYTALAGMTFDRVEPIVRHDLLRIPYSQVFLECHA